MTIDLKTAREQKGLSQQALAKLAGTSQAQIARLESGARRLTPDWAVRLAKHLDISPNDLVLITRAEAQIALEVLSLENPKDIKLRELLVVLDSPKITKSVKSIYDAFNNIYDHVSEIQKSVSDNTTLEERFTLYFEVYKLLALENSIGDKSSGSRERWARIINSELKSDDFVPVFLTTRGEGSDRDSYYISSEWEGITRRSDSILGVTDAYSIRMFDDSMVPRYDSGWLLFIDPLSQERFDVDILIKLNSSQVIVGSLVEMSEDRLTIERTGNTERLTLNRSDVLAIHRIVGSDHQAFRD
jgi:transcriptional regulator with XRE-family HTH domain